MFETWPVEALQRAGSEAWTLAALALTALGYRAAIVPALVLIAFGVHLRRGLALVHATVGTALATLALKAALARPRPFEVSEAVRVLDPWLPEESGGLPSGHAAMAVALWGGAAALFPRFPRALALAAILLVPATRVYLGVHFVGDVLAGWLLGAAALGAAAAVWTRSARVRAWLAGELPFRAVRPLALVSAVAPLPLAPWLEPGLLAAWVGLHAGLLAAAASAGDLPPEGGSAGRRAARAAAALGLFVAASLALRWLLRDVPDGAAREIAEQLPPAYLLFRGGIALGRRTGWFPARQV